MRTQTVEASAAVAGARVPLRVLVEMRPALEGHAGIPQETRLLFRGLSMLEGVHAEGLMQSAERVLCRGIVNWTAWGGW
jgi:hypothetical protein